MKKTPKIRWETDADNIEVRYIKTLLFKNSIIDEFINFENKFFLVASKGIGKTLLLKHKRSLLEDKYKYGKEGDEGYILIPQDRPYLDFATDLGILSKNHIDYLSDWKNCKTIWELAIQLSAISYYNIRKKLEKDIYLEKMKEEHRSSFKWLESNTLVSPSYVLNSILRMDKSKIENFIQCFSNDIGYDYNNIKTGIIVFIDRLDQALFRYDSSSLWINVQLGLLEGAWNLMRMNSHIKIFTSIRQEAYANYDSPNKEAISGQMSFVRYDVNELFEIINKLSIFYEGVNSFDEFISLKEPDSNTHESRFEYIHRHTIGRPRDFVSICSKLSPKRNELDEEGFRDIVITVSSKDIVSNVFSEMEILLNALRKKENREAFLALIPTNILSMSEVKEICRMFNNLTGCEFEYCKDCKFKHPFCELYNIGLLGIIEEDHSNNLKQNFIEPYEMSQFPKYVLPAKSPYYLLHSSLRAYITYLRNRSYGKKYKIVPHVIIGNSCNWEKQNEKFISTQKVIDSKVLDSETTEKILKIIRPSDVPTGIIDNLRKLSENTGSMGKDVVNITKAIDTIVKIFSN